RRTGEAQPDRVADRANRHAGAPGGGEEARQLRPVHAAEYAHVPPAPRPGARDQIDAPVPVEIPRRHGDATPERRVVRPEAGQHAQVGAAQDLDMGPAPRSRPGDEMPQAVAVDVTGGNTDPALESRVVRHEARQLAQVRPAEDPDVRAAT